MRSHRINQTVAEDGTLTISGLPFKAGEEVHVLVIPTAEEYPGQPPASLAGSVLRYDRPHDPAVDLDDFDCLNPPRSEAG